MSSNPEEGPEEIAEKAYDIMKNRIATAEHVPNDVLQSFRELTLARKKWIKEVSELPKTDPLKKRLAKSYWIEIEFGIISNMEITNKNMNKNMNKLREKLLAELNKDYISLINPFYIFSDELYDNVLPPPSRNDRQRGYEWDPSTLTVRHFYREAPEPDDDWEELLINWWRGWRDVYGAGEPMTTIRQGKNTIEVRPFIAKVKLYDGKCFTLGESLINPNKTDGNCVQIWPFRRRD